MHIYLDNNANTPVAPSVADAIADYMRNVVGNPSSVHYYGRSSKKHLTRAYERLSQFLGVRDDEIVFTSGGTEGANLVIYGLFSENFDGHIITSHIEHPSVYQTVKHLEKRGVEVSYLEPGVSGAPAPEDIRAALKPNTRLIAIMSVNNETGVKADIEAIAKIAQEAEVPFFVDAVAQFGKELVSIPPGVSAMAFSGQKIHATKGIGFCFIRRSLKLTSYMTGGEQQFGRRGGTENLPGIVGLAEAVRLLSEELPEATIQMKNLRDSFEEQMMRQLPGIAVNGEGERIANTSNLYFSGVDGETLLQKLDLAGVAASHGSACSSGNLEPSRILLKMGYPVSRVRSSVRFSVSRFTTQQEIDQAVAIIVQAVNALRAL